MNRSIKILVTLASVAIWVVAFKSFGAWAFLLMGLAYGALRHFAAVERSRDDAEFDALSVEELHTPAHPDASSPSHRSRLSLYVALGG